MSKAAKLTVFSNQLSRLTLDCCLWRRPKEREDPVMPSRGSQAERQGGRCGAGHAHRKVRDNTVPAKAYGKMGKLKRAAKMDPSGVSHGGIIPKGKKDFQLLDKTNCRHIWWNW